MVMNGGMQILKNCGTDFENNVINDLNFFYKELESYDGSRSSGSRHDDLCDACSDAFGAAAAARQIPNNFMAGLKSADSVLKTSNPFA
jgi:hypothetical protein